jgi:hypothetical protein
MGIAVGPSSEYRPMRRWTRYKIDVPIRVIAEKDSKSAIVNGRGRDIGDGGMMVFAGIEVRVNDIIEVEFTPPFGEPLRVTGRVRNRHGYYYGVEFVRDSNDDKQRSARLREVLRSMVGAVEQK